MAVLLTLRQRTAPVHQALEHHLDLLSPALDETRYGDVLVAMASVHAALEPVITATTSALDLAPRRKLPALRADLAALGRPFPPARPIPPIEREPDALGALYVTEGATLGGALIAAHVREVLPGAPRAFFEAYGPDVPRRWSEFRATARARLTTPDDIERAAATADAVFATFLDAAVAP